MSTDDSDETDGVDIDSGLLQPEDSLDNRGVLDVLDEGYSPPDRPWELNDYGLTAREAAEHESLNGRLARELPDIMIPDGDGLGDASDTDGELYDNEAGTARSGRLIDVEATGEIDDYTYLYAVDIGRDGGAASAEEAAVHIVADEDEQE
ncbi:DUF5709 domain-containing protein [Pseudonocardia xinjiangensis]|uniref:DUF5709 domain-containing protein n=1 Tax=Pseudonocardia xinjiangensis TaxID=75289 RepID=A0ABX1RD41_9PSEU|nr:DUF5709 domain-containing protein [Pseudonocardia xinjiangensis]NMH77359.1 hypothetical protein [Pseudonocardia xinjiangensis]